MEAKYYRKNPYIMREKRTPDNKRYVHRFKLTPIRKKGSKLMTEIGNKSFEDSSIDKSLDSNNATGSSGFITNNSFDEIKTLNIKLHYFINKKIKSIEVIINEDKTIKELIIFSLQLINEQLISEKLNIQFDLKNLNNYCIKSVNNEKELNDNNTIINDNSFLSNICLDQKFFLEWNDEKKSNIIPYIREENKNEKQIKGLLMKNKIMLDDFTDKIFNIMKVKDSNSKKEASFDIGKCMIS